jgi:uncharacterized membrane protein
MTGVAVVLVLCSATLHAAWNILLKASDDPLRTAARTIPMATLAVTPAVVVAWLATGRPLLPPAALAVAAGSGLLELAYFRFLSAAFRAGDLSTVYPIARGTAPALAAAAGLVLLGERLDTLQLVGVGAIIAGIWLVRPARGDRAAVPPALLTGVCIAGYSTLDGIGVRLGPPWLYAWLLFLCMSLCLLPHRGHDRVRNATAIGALTVSAYGLVLFALSMAPLALVAPLRETGVVLVASWGVFVLRERVRAAGKLVGAAVVVAGAALLTAG